MGSKELITPTMKSQAEEHLTELIKVLSDEELIRFAYRSKKIGNKELADLLKDIVKQREKEEEKK